MDRSRLLEIRPPSVDIAIAVVLTMMGIVLALGNTRIYQELVGDVNSPSDLAIVLTVSVAVIPIAFRRVFPLGSLLAITAGTLLTAVYGVIEVSATVMAAFGALVSAGIYGRESYRDWARGLFAVGIGAIFVAFFISRSGANTASISPRLVVAVASAELLANTIFVGLGWVLGDLERRRRGLATDLADRNAELQTALGELDAQSANMERLAIAREVHDIVGHTVSLMGVQAAAARRQVRHDPETAESILRAMEEQSRSTVDEIRSLIAVLRGPAGNENGASVTPTPSLDQLDDLVDQVRAAGADVVYSSTGSLPDGAAIGLSIYRVVQEAISNAIRHGSGGTEVVVTADDQKVAVFVSNEVDDSVVRSGPADKQTGTGLAGMRERIGLHGGTLQAGRQQDGRFELHAVLPVAASAGSPPVTASEHMDGAVM